MKKVINVAPKNLSYFKIIDELPASYIKVYLLDAKFKDYENILDWLHKKMGILGQIEQTNGVGLVFKSAEMSVRMALYMLQSDSSLLKYNFQAIDLAKFIIKLHPRIDSVKSGNLFGELKKILLEMSKNEIDTYHSMKDLALKLGIEAGLQALPLKLKNANPLEDSHILLGGIINVLINGKTICCKLVDKINESMKECNQVAHRATVAVELLHKLNKMNSIELSMMLKDCSDGHIGGIDQMQSDSEEILSHYLRKFKLPESLVRNCNESRAEIHNAHHSVRKPFPDPFDYLSHRVFKINQSDIDQLAFRVSQLNKVKKTAELILSVYHRLWSYIKNRASSFSEVLPELSDLVSPLFDQYNSCPSPLIWAIVDNRLNQTSNLKLFSELAKAKPFQHDKHNVSLYCEGGFRGEFMSPLCHAVERAIPDVARIILENKATVNPVDNRKTPLHRAMILGDLEILKLLLKFGARPDLVTDDDGYTALHYSENAECADYLINWVAENAEKYPNISLPTFIDARDRYGNTPLQRICQRKVVYFSRFSEKNNENNTEKKSERHLKLMQLLIDYGADVNAVSHQGLSALHYVLMIKTQYEYDEIHIPTVISAIKILLEAGADVNLISGQTTVTKGEKSFQLFTPMLGLFDPIYIGNISAFGSNKNRGYFLRKVTEMLVDHGASINVFDENLKNPLVKAILFGAVSSVNFLLESRANPNLRANKNMPTPLHYCMNNSDGHFLNDSNVKCLEYLFAAGASPRLLLQKSFDIKFETKSIDKKLTTNIHIMRLILEQENEFSRYAKNLDMTDNAESIEERFIRIWSALDMKDLTISLWMNALEYSNCLSNKSSSPNPLAVVIFNEWLNLYESTDIVGLINVLCLSSQYSLVPNELVLLFAQQFSDNPKQVKLIQHWIFEGRRLSRTRPCPNDALSISVLPHQNIFAQGNHHGLTEEESISISPEVPL